MLPISNSGSKRGSGARHKHSNLILNRLLKPSQMDYNYALWTMLQLVTSPKVAYRQTSYHKQTKNYYARDDPAFIVISAAILAIVASIYTIIYTPGFWNILASMLHAVIVNYLGLGCLLATISWFVANKMLTKEGAHSHATQEQDIEWLYAFDVHCNAFVPLFLILGVVQLVLLPILTLQSWFAAALSSIMYSGAISLYFYVTFLGFSSLPSLDSTEVYLYPIAAVVVSLPIALLVGFNPTTMVLHLFGLTR